MVIVYKGTENKIAAQHPYHKKGFQETHQAQVFFLSGSNQSQRGKHAHFNQGETQTSDSK